MSLIVGKRPIGSPEVVCGCESVETAVFGSRDGFHRATDLCVDGAELNSVLITQIHFKLQI
jgi:hypothetical protein